MSALNETIAVQTMSATTATGNETAQAESTEIPLQQEQQQEQQRQRRFGGHIHQITAFAVSPCGLFVASSSIGPTVGTSCLLAWRLRDGLSVNTAPGESRPAAFEGNDEVDPVLEAGSSCVVAKGNFEGGVGALVSAIMIFDCI
jgi:hypothetical protein